MHLKFIKTHISAQSQRSNFIIPSVRVHNRIDIDTNHREEDDWEGGVIREDSVLYSANMRIKSIASKFNSTFSAHKTYESKIYLNYLSPQKCAKTDVQQSWI